MKARSNSITQLAGISAPSDVGSSTVLGDFQGFDTAVEVARECKMRFSGTGMFCLQSRQSLLAGPATEVQIL